MTGKHPLIILCLLANPMVLAAEDPQDPEQVLEARLWGQLYANGGTTLYCQEPFDGQDMLVTESPVYFLGQARQFLRCGTRRQCLQENGPDQGKYRALVTDLHNYFPARTRFEHRRRGPHYSEIGVHPEPGECGERSDFGRFEPPPHARGIVARALFHVHSRYQLPLPGDLSTLREWHQTHPPDKAEQARNRKIEEIQGFDNPFISNPALAEQLL